MATVPYITATLIYDEYAADGPRVAMHHHLVGHTVASVHRLRYPDVVDWDDETGEIISNGFDPCNAHWPMVDLWARVPADVFDGAPCNDATALYHAKRLQGITDEYTGHVGW